MEGAVSAFTVIEGGGGPPPPEFEDPFYAGMWRLLELYRRLPSNQARKSATTLVEMGAQLLSLLWGLGW
jgi:hypothetical protein